MANIDTKAPTVIYVLWLIIAIVGTALLYTGIQLSVANVDVSFVIPVMLIVIGIMLTFFGLIMVLGYANIEAKTQAMKDEAKSKKK